MFGSRGNESPATIMQRRTAAKTRPNSHGIDPPAHQNGNWIRNSEPVLPRREPKPSSFGSDRGGHNNKRFYDNPAGTKIIQTLRSFALGPCYDFLHARTGVRGCRLSGIIRVCYSVLFLYSAILMTIQVPVLFDPRKGLVPYMITGEAIDDWQYSVFEFAPQSSLLVYLVFFLGVSSGVLLLLGIQPRWAAAGVFFFLKNLESHNTVLWDGEYRMNRLWAFFLMFMPLDHVTIRDGFGGLVPLVRQKLKLSSSGTPLATTAQQPLGLTTSWPMWPFRLWQVYTCMVYMGAGFGKLNSRAWIRGNALSWSWYDEGLGRFYPAFVIEIMFNRLVSIKLQTWVSLVIENLCFVTIWPMKTRKITFVAIVMLHIGIELAMLMHIFEYLSVLGWACFFAYPRDGKSSVESRIEDRKYDKRPSGASATASGSKRRSIIVQTVAAVSLLYLLIYDIFPSEEAERLMPAPVAYLAERLVYPPTFVSDKLSNLVTLTGINADPYILFKGKPPHSQSRITAVVRFNDGKKPILHLDEDWADSSMLQRELNYWYDTYLYYLVLDKGNDSGDVPYFAAFSIYIAELYGNGGVEREYSDITIEADNTVESISIQVHKRTGSERPAPPDWGLFASIPREWRYQSVCRYVFEPDRFRNGHQKRNLDMETLLNSSANDSVGLRVQNGCENYNPADEALHRRGQYGMPTLGSLEIDAQVGDDEEDDETGHGPFVRMNEEQQALFGNGRYGVPMVREEYDGEGNDGHEERANIVEVMKKHDGEGEDEGSDSDIEGSGDRSEDSSADDWVKERREVLKRHMDHGENSRSGDGDDHRNRDDGEDSRGDGIGSNEEGSGDNGGDDGEGGGRGYRRQRARLRSRRR